MPTRPPKPYVLLADMEKGPLALWTGRPALFDRQGLLEKDFAGHISDVDRMALGHS